VEAFGLGREYGAGNLAEPALPAKHYHLAIEVSPERGHLGGVEPLVAHVPGHEQQAWFVAGTHESLPEGGFAQ